MEREGAGTLAMPRIDPGRRGAPVDAAMQPPALAPGMVERSRLLGRLSESSARVALVVAPAGFGKTTVLAQWAAIDNRPVGWLSLSESDNDPPLLLARLLVALDSVGPVSTTDFEAIAMSTADLPRVVLPRLATLIHDLPPFLLVLDDTHFLRASAAAQILRLVVEQMPVGSCAALAGRSAPSLPIARWRANRQLIDLQLDDLAMSEEEGTALLRGANLDVTPSEAALLVEVTEGWPAGLYLSTLALRHRSPHDALSYGGDDRLLAEYFLDEVLSTVPDEHAAFLMHCSVLDRLTGPACDAVLQRDSSTILLGELERSNLFVIALDRTRTSYRFHHLFRDLLRAELRCREPELERTLHRRASEWSEHHGDYDQAVAHAQAAGDIDRVEALIWSVLPVYVSTNRTATVLRWLEPFDVHETASRAPLALASAWAAFTSENTADVERWATILDRHRGDGLLPDGTPLLAAIALLDALVGKHGLHQVREDAAVAYELHPTGSVWRPLACLLGGTAARLLGDFEAARSMFEEVLNLGRLLPPSLAECNAQLALLAGAEGAWDEAERLVDVALDYIDEFGLAERPVTSQVYAIASWVRARAGSSDAKDLAKRGAWLLTMLKGVTPFVAIEARILLARTMTLVAEGDHARILLSEAEHELEGFPDAGSLPLELAEAKARLEAAELPLGVSAAPLTPAELRILRYLPTHLTIAEIADEVFVSRNTVKTHSIALYRKLGVGTRSAAVERARRAGLLEP